MNSKFSHADGGAKIEKNEAKNQNRKKKRIREREREK